MKLKDTIEITIINYGSQGEGIAKYLDFTVFVPFVCVGDVVMVCVTHIKGNIIYAKVIKLVKAGADRVIPKCGVFTKCGGCQLQQLSYDKQLEFKRGLVSNNIRKLAEMEIEVPEVIASPKQYKYRNKLSLPIGIADNKVVLGFYKSDSHDIVSIDSCPLQEDWADKLIKTVKQYVTQYNVSIYDNKKGLLRQVAARYIDGQILVTMVINGDFLPNYKELASLLAEEFKEFGLFININKTTNNVILCDTSKHICSSKHISACVCGIKIKLQPDSFFQVNNDVRDLIYKDVVTQLCNSKADIVFDVFSGIGVLSAIIAKNNFKTIGIEINRQAYEDANVLTKLNGLEDRLTNICADANTELPKLISRYSSLNIAMVVDPPRKGLGSQLIETILQAMPTQIIYISCDSATLARDIKQLKEYYNLTYIQHYDMFPQTRHIETLVRLQLKK